MSECPQDKEIRKTLQFIRYMMVAIMAVAGLSIGALVILTLLFGA